MPIQPLAPTVRLNSAAVRVAVAGPVRIEGAGGDLLGEERAHLAAQRLAFGRQADLDRSAARCHASSISAPPAAARTRRRRARATALPSFDRPIAFVAEVVAPGQHAQREAMQHVLLGEADGAEHLMRDGGAFGGGLGASGSWPRPLRGTRPRRSRRAARWRRRRSRRRRARRRLRRQAARGCAAPPGICRSAARRRRARWHSAR